jgi:hypothetical protein
MKLKKEWLSPGLLFAAGLSTLSAATIYNESVSGDLSNSGLSPTTITVALGSNQIFGTTGNQGGAIDRDYFTITIGVGQELTGLTVLPGTTSGGPVSFIGLESGPQVTLQTGAVTAVGLLGWWHYSPADINSNILGEMGTPSNGSSGFSVPLGAGNYSFWVQDFNAGSFNYGFDLTVSSATTPEPGTIAAALVGLLFVAMLRAATPGKRSIRL